MDVIPCVTVNHGCGLSRQHGCHQDDNPWRPGLQPRSFLKRGGGASSASNVADTTTCGACGPGKRRGILRQMRHCQRRGGRDNDNKVEA